MEGFLRVPKKSPTLGTAPFIDFLRPLAVFRAARLLFPEAVVPGVLLFSYSVTFKSSASTTVYPPPRFFR